MSAPCSVNSAIVQRYLDKILESSLSVFADIQKVAMDILALTIDQGLAHPMQVSLCVLTGEAL
jgi:hypothetical protein